MAQRGKGKPMAFPGDFIALGAKSTSSTSATKRDGGSTSSGLLPKKPKLSSGSSTISIRPPASTSTIQSMPPIDKSHVWESLAIEFETTEFLELVNHAEEKEDKEKTESLLCGAAKLVKNNRTKLDQMIYLPLMYLAKSREYLFYSEHVIEAFCSLLRRDLRESYKFKGNSQICVLAANLLLSAYREEKTWPELFVRVYVEDAISERIWVDHPDCKPFVDNILTAFNTKISHINSSNNFFPGGKVTSGGMVATSDTRESCPSPPVGAAAGGSGSRSESGSATPTRPGTDDDSLQGVDPTLPINAGDPNLGLTLAHLSPNEIIQVVPRYQGKEESIERFVMEIVHEQINRRQGTDNITRNFLRFLTNACGLVEIRQVIVPKLEMWVMNPKVSRQAQDLLLSLAANCSTHSAADVEVLGNFTKLRFKNKPNINLYLAALREICQAHKENLPALVKHTIFNELSNARNQNNMSMLHVMFSVDPVTTPTSLAAVFLELLLQKECYLRALRALLREIVRAMRHDVNLHLFCIGLLQEPRTHLFKDFEFKDRMFASIVDLLVLAIFLGISPAVRESMTSYWRNDKKDPISYKNFLKQTALIQRDAMAWIRDSSMKWFKPDANGFYMPALHKLLFIASSEEYYRADGWPAESDRGLYFKATSEIPLLQETLLSLLVIGIAKGHPLNGRDAVDLVDCLVKRASGLHPLATDEFPVLAATKVTEIMECLFQSTAYNFPETITLPPDYTPPSMAIASAYWKAWLILVLLCAHNPTEFGAVAWKTYQTLTACMEMCITNQFTFPPPTIATGEEADDLKSKELQVSSLEKQAILDFEMHLAAATNKATITESSSLLLAQLITMDPSGSLRRPPQQFLDQLQLANKNYKIGHLLCRSRNPDFLLDILQRQGTNQAMPWLADLVESSEGSFHVLPVQCLCEFLLNSSLTNVDEGDDQGPADTDVMANKKLKQKQLLLHLQDLLQNPKSDFRACTETLEYFLRRLSSQQTRQRLQALRGLRLVLTPISDGHEQQDEGNDWLLTRLPALPNFASFYPQISTNLRVACQYENDPNAVSLYVQFLANYTPDNLADFTELCLEIGSIIVERSTLLPAILPGGLCKTPLTTADDTYTSLLRLFVHYMGRVRQPQQALPTWSADTQEMFNIMWETEGLTATIHYCIVLAQIILLTYGPPNENSKSFQIFHELMNIWYPSNGQDPPRAFSIDAAEEVDLIPDWLKLRMIRSEAGLLVDAALSDLEPQKLVLFIQSFGIPVASMAKLLQNLDRIVESDFEGVNEAVMDKTYMGQLVAVQHQRGATGGHRFAEALGLNLNHQTQSDSKEMSFKNVRRVPPIVPPRSTAMIPPAAVKTTLLHLFDVGSPCRMTQKEKQDTLRTLQKYLTSEVRGNSEVTPMIDATVKALDQILKSELKESFSIALVQRTAFSCGLFCLISNALLKPVLSSSASANLLIKVCETILALQRDKASSPLKTLLENHLRKSKKPSQRPNRQSQETDKNKESFEETLRHQVEDAVQRKSTKSLVDSMAKLLLKGDAKKSSKTMEDKESKVGLLIDWMQMLDPELVQASTDVRLSLLFSQIDKDGTAKHSRPHLLTLMTHQASWSTLHDTVDKVLSKMNPDFDPSAVLDFLETCVHLQKQWQCTDKHVPKHDSGPQDVLSLTNHQVDVMIEYCLEEICNSATDVESAKTVIQKRINFIVGCIPTRARSKKVSDLLREKLLLSDEDSDDDESDDEKIGKKLEKKDAAKELLLQIYMKVPQCLLHITGDDYSRILPESVSTDGSTSVVDCISHSLLSALAATQQGREWGKQMIDFEIAARKVAATHPVLVLRNLPLIAASLKGRTQYDFSFFRSRNHMTLFTISLGLMELLVPFIFRPVHTVPLQEALNCYFEMMSSYFSRKESMSGLVDRFISFLHQYVEHQPSEAVRFIRQFGTMLPEYAKAKDQHNLSNIHRLISLTRVTDTPPAPSETSSVVACLGSQSYTKAQEMALQMEAKHFSFVASEEIKSETEIHAALEAIKRAASTKPGLLVHLVEEITASLSHPNKIIRTLAHDLLLLLLKHSPNLGRDVIPSLINCIESRNSFVAASTTEKLPDLSPLLQEHLQTLMCSAFSVGLNTDLEVSSHIADTISTLNSQKGF